MEGRGRSRARKRKFFSRKRLTSFLLAAAMVCTNIGSDLSTAYAAGSSTDVSFEMRGSDLVTAIEDAIATENVVTPDDLNFTNGKVDDFEGFLFGEGKLYEAYPEMEGGDVDADMRVFVRLPEDADDMYAVTGDEEVIFLYINNSDETVRFRSLINYTKDGEDKVKKTDWVSVRSYESVYGDEEVNVIPDQPETEETAETPETTVPETEAPVDETTEAPAEEDPIATDSEMTVSMSPNVAALVAAPGDDDVATPSEITGGEETADEPETTAPEESNEGLVDEGNLPEESVSESQPAEETTPADETTKAPETTAPAKDSVATEDEIQSAPKPSYSDLVGIGWSGTGKIYTSTLNKLHAFDDVEGWKVEYSITPEGSARIIDGARGVEDGEDLYFGVKNQIGYAVESVLANGEELTADTITDNEDGSQTAWYAVYGVTEEQSIDVVMAETGEHPAYSTELTMEDGTVIHIHAAEGVLPAGVEAVASVVTGIEDVVKENVEAEAEAAGEEKEVIASLSYNIDLLDAEGNKLDDQIWSGVVEVTFSGAPIEENSKDADAVEVMYVATTKEDEVQADIQAEDVVSVETVSDTVAVEADAGVEAVSFEAEHFSTYTVTFIRNNNSRQVRINIVDLNGTSIGTDRTFSYTVGTSWKNVAEIAAEVTEEDAALNGYQFDHATVTVSQYGFSHDYELTRMKFDSQGLQYTYLVSNREVTGTASRYGTLNLSFYFGSSSATARFDGNGQTQATVYTKTAENGQVVLPTIEEAGITEVEEGREFLGWSVSASDRNNLLSAGTTVSISRETTYYAIWSYRVKFDPNTSYGGVGEPFYVSVEANGYIVTPENPFTNSNGYSFVGWHGNSSGHANGNGILQDTYMPGVQFPASTYGYTITSDITLYANWNNTDASSNEKVYFFIRTDGRIPFEPRGYEGGDYFPDANDEDHWLSGYLHELKEINNNTQAVEDNIRIAPTKDEILAAAVRQFGANQDKFDPATQKVLWYVIKQQAEWHVDGVIVDEDSYVVRYYPNGGDENVPAGSAHHAGENVTVDFSTIPNRIGYTFLGWSENPSASEPTYTQNGAGSFSMPERDVNLYAIWKANDQTAYTVEYYYAVNGQYSDTATSSVGRTGTTGTTVSVTDADKTPTISGYVYDTGAGNVENGTIAGDGSLVLKVYFKEQFTVTYEPGDHGTFEIQTTENLNYGADTPAFSGETTGDAGYTFAGWSPTVAGTVTGNATYVAQWTANTNTKYTVEYYYEEDGQYSETATTSVERTGTTGTRAEVTEDDKTPTISGYVYDTGAGNVENGTIAGDGSLVLKVYFKEQFTVTYAPGLHGTFASQPYPGLDYGDDTPVFSGETTGDAGYTFAGWSPTVAGTVTGNATYVAQWTANTNTKYTVEYYYEEDGQYSETATTSVERTGTTGTRAEVTEDDKTPTISGYVYDTGAGNVENGTIAGDGSLVLKVYFKEQFTVTYEPGDHGTFEIQTTENLNYGADTPVFSGETTGDAGYTFTGWSPTVAGTVTGNATYVAQWTANTNTKYTVEYYYEEDGQYSETATTSVERTGTTGTRAEVTEDDKTPTISGYVYDTGAGNVENGTIAGDGSLVLKVYFKEQFTVTYEPGDHGTFETQTTENLNYGADTPAFSGETTGDAGYTFAGWSPTVAGTVTGNATYVAQWTANTNTKYTVEYYYEEDGQYSETATTSVERTGTTGTRAEVTEDDKTPTISGYVYDTGAGNVENGTIAGDGSLVLKVYFKEQFTVTYEPGDHGTFETQTTENLNYGADTPAFSGETTGDAGYTFAGWSPTVAGTVTGNATYVAQWTANTNTKYTVEYYYEEDGQYSETATTSVERTGTTGTRAEVTEDDKTPTISGYVYDTGAGNVENGTIAGDGSLVLKVYFKEQFTVTYAPGLHGTFASQPYPGLDYGDDTPAFSGETTGDAGYTFAGWSPTVAGTVTGNATYVAQWTANTNTKYTVEYYYEEDGQYSETATTSVERTGTTGTRAEVTEDDKTPTISGYVYDTGAGNVENGTIAGDGSLVLKVYFKEQFTVTYEPGDHGTFETQTTENLNYGADTPVFSGETTGDAGYTFTGWSPTVAGTVTGNATYVAQWTANTDTKYMVEYYYQNYDGSYPETANSYDVRNGETDTLAAVNEQDKIPQRSGYIFDEDNESNRLSGNIDGDGSLVLKLYFERGIFEYTVIEHYENADGVEIATVPKSGTATLDEAILELSGVIVTQTKEYEGNNYYLESVDGYDKLVSADETQNVVHIYYTIDNVGGKDPENPENPDIPDNVPDKYQVEVTYEAVNGSVTITDTQYVTIYENGDPNGNWATPSEMAWGYLNEDQIANATADAGYDPTTELWTLDGKPTVKPSSDDAIREDRHYVITFEKGMYDFLVIEHYENADGEEVGTVETPGTAVYEEAILELSGVIVTQTKEYEGNNYYLESVDGYDKLVSADETQNVVHIYYTIDNVGGKDPENPENPDIPDNVPDKYQVEVTYEAVNGSVTITDTQYVTIYENGDPNGNWATPSEMAWGYLNEDQIANATADAGYDPTTELWTLDGKPTVKPSSDDAIREDRHYVITFEKGMYDFLVIEHYENADGVEIATVSTPGTGVFEESIIELSGVAILQNKEYEGHTYTLTGVDGHDKLISADETQNVIHIYYALDEKGGTDPENPDNPGPDDVPDKYQIVFTYVSADENTGTVTGTTREVYTFKDAAGNYVENTGISPNAIEGHNPVADPAENYAFHYWTVQGQEERDYTVGMTFLGQKVYTTDTTFVAHFAEDKINDTTDGEDPNVPEDPNQPDGIPDIYQIVFTYVTEDATHGTVDGMVTEVRTFPRNGETGEYDTTAAISPNVGVTITTIGRYRFDNWTNGAGTVYDTDDLLRAASFTEDQTFTAHFYRAPGSGSGDGGNGGGGTSTPGGPYNPGAGPGVTITEPEVPLAPLPTEDGGSTVIFDDNVPLAPLPKTGQQSLKTPITMLLAGIFLAFASLTKRKEEN